MLPSNNTYARRFSETHISEDCRAFFSKEIENGLFFDCDFANIAKSTIKNCDLNGSRIKPESIKDMLGVTMTLDCHTFKDVELNELALDCLLTLLAKTKGNDLKRAKIIDIIGDRKYKAISKVMGDLE